MRRSARYWAERLSGIDRREAGDIPAGAAAHVGNRRGAGVTRSSVMGWVRQSPEDSRHSAQGVVIVGPNRPA